jgi:hypothetical protein
VFTVRNDKNLQWSYEMECNIEVIVGQTVECSNEKIVIRAPVKDEKDWLQDFQLKLNSAWIARNTFPSFYQPLRIGDDQQS